MARRRNNTLGSKLATGTKNAASFLFVPSPGSRKTHITLWVIIPFLLICTVALFWFKIDPVQWIKTVGDVLTYVAGLFMGSNAIENGANILNKNKTNGNGNEQPAPPPAPKPGPPVPSPFLKKEDQPPGPPIPKPPGS